MSQLAFQAFRHRRLLVRQQVRHLVRVQVAVLTDDLRHHALDEQGRVFDLYELRIL